MTSIRIAVVSALVVAAVFAGGSSARPSAPAPTSHAIAMAKTGRAADPVLCC